jgi:D12 class N6 adenine-specific DNA methyltransferase
MLTIALDNGLVIQGGKPFLRWAGSKRKQLARLRAFWSDGHTGYIERFAGSACLFFALGPHKAVLGDSNRELIEVTRLFGMHLPGSAGDFRESDGI